MTTPRLKNAVEAIAAAHSLDLSEVGTHIRLDMPHMNRLCIEVIWNNQISIARYYMLNGDLVPDPDVVVLVTPEGWIPITFQNLYAYSEAVELDDDGGIQKINEKILKGLVEFCDEWGASIEGEKWAESGQKVCIRPSTREALIDKARTVHALRLRSMVHNGTTRHRSAEQCRVNVLW